MMKPEFIKVLSDNEILQIHQSTVTILEQTGVSVQHPDLLERLKMAGAIVDDSKNIAKFPKKMINAYLGKAPSTIKLYSRDGKEPLEIGKGITYSVNGFDATFFLEYKTGERHPITAEEVENFTWIADQLNDIDIVGIQGIPQDVPQETTEAHAVFAMLQNTSKHLIIAPDTGNVSKIVYKMLEIAAGSEDISSRPIASCHISPTSPLIWSKNACDIILETVPKGIPFLILPSPMAGATSPVTMAGHLVVHNTEVISGYLIAQIIRNGAPVVYCNPPTLFNMREANPIIAAPETMLLRIAGAQMPRFYGIPSHSIGFDTDSHIVDQQGAWEKSLTGMVCIQAGIDLMVNLGMFSTGMATSYAQLLLDHEVFSLLKRFRAGIEVSDEHLAVDLIQKICPFGAFIEEEHTLKHFKNENWYPEISCRKLYEPWEKEGCKDAAQVAHEKAMELLKRERPEFINNKMKQEIKKLLESA